MSCSNTANLFSLIKTGVGGRLLLTDNHDISDRLINGAVGKVLYMDVNRNKPVISRIFVKFGDPSASNSRKDGMFWRELKHCDPVTAETKSFPHR